MGILLAEKQVDKVIEVVGVYLCLDSFLQNRTATIISVYTPQMGLLDEQKDSFYDTLLQTI